MTTLQKRIVVTLTVLIALSRLLATAHALNDWDEGLFSLGVREYDVNKHHPHPPGYPLFIAAAKFIHFFGVDEFRSLQGIVLLGSFVLFPALFFLAREIGFDFTTSVCGAAIYAFLPNVWIYSGTGFSDIPATALGLAACALLLRGRRDSRAYILGAVVLGVAAGFRAPNLLIGMVPALLATVHRLRARDFRSVLVAVVLGGAIVGGSYLGAAVSSESIETYRRAVKGQSEYVRKIDSWHNPNRLPLRKVAEIFFLWPMQMRQQMTGLAALAIIGLMGILATRRWGLLLPLAIFGPFMIAAWLNLDFYAAGRYAIAYLAVHALFAAYGLRVMGRLAAVQTSLAFAIVALFVVWTWPALRQQRTTDAPPAAALLWIQRNVPKTSVVFVAEGLTPQARFLLPDHDVTFFGDEEQISQIDSNTWVVQHRFVDGATMNFVWPRSALWKILRRRNFESAVLHSESFVQFGKGWYLPEGTGTEVFRWMGKEGHVTLPSMRGKGRLTIRFGVPIDVVQPPPTIEVTVNGRLVERFIGAQANMEKSWIVPSRPAAMNELRIVTSEAPVPAKFFGGNDTRELGLRVDRMSWVPAR